MSKMDFTFDTELALPSGFTPQLIAERSAARSTQFASAVAPQVPPEVSVIMPVYNAEATLDATVRSVLAQSFAWFELIAIDDGSRDGSLALLLELAATDPRIKVVSRANDGVSSARNLGADLASSPLLAFLDADDLWTTDKLACHVALHREEPELAASYARIAFIAEDAAGLDGAKTHSSLCRHMPCLTDVLGENPVCTASNLVVDRRWFLATGGFDPRLSYAEDQEFAARLIARGGKLGGVDAVLTGYRLSPGGLSMDLARMYEGWRLVAASFLPVGECTALEALYCRYLARRVLRAGGRPWQSLSYVAAGLRLDAKSFLADRRRGWSTVAAALVAPLLPTRLRLRLFA